jgi:DNA-binding CsgD family transcriptional regulator
LKHFDVTSDGWRYGSLIAAFSLIGLLAAGDLIGDLDQGVSGYHLLAEGAVVGIALAAAAALIRALMARTHELNRRLASSDEAARAWRREAESLLRGLGASIDRQFGRWHLSGAEKEVALLLLKGLSHKEIARARGIGEATARQQATAVYRKAGVEGRNDLAAFFLEDLALPRQRSDTITADPDAGPTRGTRRIGSVGDACD